jgi:hypothetical protein
VANLATEEKEDNMTSVETINVKYAPVDGMHFFLANDAYSHGLCVAHQDLEIAFNEATIQLAMLLKQNHGLDCGIEPAVSFEEFDSMVKAAAGSTSLSMRVGRT